MHDDVDVVAVQYVEDRPFVADVGVLEPVVVRILDRPQGGEISGIGQLVEVGHAVGRIAAQMPAHRRADEAGAAGHQKVHAALLTLSPPQANTSAAASIGALRSLSES